MPLRFLITALSFGLASLAVQAQVVADPQAPAGQRPTVLRSANGVTQVNVQTPSAAGVSRNTYRQFDVPAQGVILNNSRTDTPTELGGWVQGNPWLARGPARILLNEVVSADPSRLAGRVEVAGQRAEVVIANPSGITCSGCGFLNASRATLTTGTPVLVDGALQGYRVQGGHLEIGGSGLDARGTDYAALIARAVRFNANVWARHLAVVAGANEVAASVAADAPPSSTPLPGTGPAPRVLIDVSALGGLYAGKIYLVGTEAGLGVVQTGRILASDDLVLRTDGWLTQSGRLEAGKTLHLEAGGLDNNRGGIAAARVQVLADKVRNHAGVILSDEDLWIASRGKVDNGSGLMAAGRALQIDARELSVGRAGSVQSKGWLSVNAGSVDNADGGTFAGMSTRLMARDRFTNRGLVDGAYTRIDAGSIHNLGTGRLFGDRLSIGADTLTNDTETVGGVRADAVIAARERLDIGVRELTNREHALIFSAGTADDAMTIGGSLDAQGRATGQAEQVTNRSATIESMGGLSLHARRLDNSNAHFGTHIVQSLEPTQRAYIQPEGGAMLPAELFNWESWSRAGRYRYRSDPPTGAGAVLGQSPVPRVGEQACTGEDGQEVCTRLPGADYPAGDPAWAYFGQPAPAPEPAPPTLPEPVPPDASRAASCSSGGPPQDATTCEAYRTDLATYQAAHAVYTQAWADHTAQRQAWQADTDARYARLDGLIEAYNAGFAHRYIQNWTQYQVTRSERETRVLHSDPGRLLSGGDMHLAGGELVNDKSQIVSGGALTGDLANLRTVEAAGLRIVSESGTSQYTASRWRGGFRRYHQRDWGLVAPYAPADEVTSFVLPVAQRREHAGSLTGIASLPTLATRPGVIDPAGALSGLFQPTADTAAPYFIETDPRFTQRHPWQQIIQAQRGGQIDPDPQHKRLGDAFFEQQLIRDQVLRLTGQRFLAGYADDETQYQALLQAGTTLAQAHRLRPGVALTASQMAQLTTDVVWMVLTDVVLPDGRTVQALVPHLHVVNRPGLDAAGALLVGHSVDLRLSGDLVNEGTIAARADLAIEADNIHNLGGQLQADAVAAQARGDLLNRAGVIQAGRVLGVEAGRDLVIESTTHTQRAQDGLSSGERTHIDRLASLYVTGPGGTLLARAGRDLRMAGAHVVNRPSVPVQLAGATVIVAGRDLLLESVQESGSTRTVANAGNFSVHARQSDAGSRIDTQGDLTLAAGRDVRAVAATGSSQDGEVKVLAGRDLAWAAGRAREQRDEARQLTQRGTLSRTTTTTRHTLDDTAAVAGVLSGRTVSVQAGQDLRVTGSQVVSTDATRLAAGRDLTLDAVTQSRVSQSLRDERKSGVFSSGGVGVTLGVRQQTAEQDNAATTVAATTVGSTDGSVVITAGQAYRQVGSDVLAPEGDIAIGAGQVDIVEGRESSRTQVRTRSRQSGVTLAVSNPVISAAQTARQMADAASHTQDSRMQVLAAASTVLAVRSAAKALADPKGQPALAGGVNVNISLGRSHSESQTVQVTEQAVASSVVAGGSAVIRASGAGAASDLTVQGSTVQAERGLTLQADHDIRLQAARNTATQESRHRSDSASVGVGFGLGPQGAGLSLTASTGAARGNADGQDVTWTSAQLQAGEQLRMASAGDTTLRGAVAQGAQVQADVGGRLAIESLQDTQRYDSRERSANASLSVGGQTRGSMGAGRSHIDGDYASVNDISGLRAGDGGFQVSVQGGAVLEGGVITSTQAAVEAGSNRFAAESLALRDIDNRARYGASSVSVNLGAGHNAEGQLAPQGSSAGAGRYSGEASSVTRAGISGAAGHRDVRTGDASTGITPILDAQRVHGEIDAQTQITQRFGLEAPRAVADFAQLRVRELGERARALPPGEERERLLGEARAWEEGGLYRVALHASLGGLGGGVPGAFGAGAAAVAAPSLDALQAQLAQALRTAGASDAVARAAAQWVAQTTAIALGAAVSGGTSPGAAAALNVDANNRQLHPAETRWIRDNARRYARARGLSESEAEKQLADQAFRQVQSGAQGDWDPEAAAFLRSAGRQLLPADPSQAQAGPGYLFYATPQQQVNARMYLDEVMRSPQALDFYRTHRIQQPTVEQILQAAGTSQAARETVRGQTVRAALAAAALALAPSFSGAVEAVAAFAKDPVGYCMAQPTACLVSAELAATAAADAPVSGVHLPAAGKAVRTAIQEAQLAEEIAALRAMGARNTTVAAQLDHAVIGRSEAALYNDLAERAKVRVDTRNDAFYAARTDRSILTQYKMDMNHVLAGEINARGAATGFHAEFAAGGAARIRPDAVITRYANGTYDAKVEIWDPTKSLWVEKRQQSTFFPPSWSQARIEYEITEAFKAGVPRTGFVGMSPGGIEIQFRWDAKNQRTTFYPLKGEK